MLKRLAFMLAIALLLIGCSTSKELVNNDENLAYATNSEQMALNPLRLGTLGEYFKDRVIFPRANIVAVGDIMFHGPQINGAKTDHGYDFSETFKFVSPIIGEADLALANFETVTAGNDKGFRGFPRFNAPDETLDAIKAAGFDVLSTANNHSLDQGKFGITRTIEELEKRSIEYVGTSKDTRRPFIIKEVNGIKVGLLSYTYGLNGLDNLLTENERSRMVNLINRELIAKDIAASKKAGAEFVAVYMHWGAEYNRSRSEAQQKLGHFILDSGADIVLGSHPHVIQEIERVSYGEIDKYIIYSMGNFISNQRYDTMGVSYAEDGMMIDFSIEKNPKDNVVSIKDVKVRPTWVFKFPKGKLYGYHILPIQELLNGEVELTGYESYKARIEKSLKDTLEKTNY